MENVHFSPGSVHYNLTLTIFATIKSAPVLGVMTMKLLKIG